MSNGHELGFVPNCGFDVEATGRSVSQAALSGSEDHCDSGKVGCGGRLAGRRTVPRYSSILTTFRLRLDADLFFWVSRLTESNVKIAMASFLFAHGRNGFAASLGGLVLWPCILKAPASPSSP